MAQFSHSLRTLLRRMCSSMPEQRFAAFGPVQMQTLLCRMAQQVSGSMLAGNSSLRRAQAMH